MGIVNTRIVLARRPVGEATADCFSVEVEPLRDLEAGQVRVAVEFISVDAGTRTMLRGEGFRLQVGLGQVIHAGGSPSVSTMAASGPNSRTPTNRWTRSPYCRSTRDSSSTNS